MRLLIAGLTAVVCILGSGPGAAHSWYPRSCCSEHDCFPIETDQLVEQPDGSWKYLPTGTVFPKDRVYPSQDSKFHVCISPTTGHPFCAFILQGS